MNRIDHNPKRKGRQLMQGPKMHRRVFKWDSIAMMAMVGLAFVLLAFFVSPNTKLANPESAILMQNAPGSDRNVITCPASPNHYLDSPVMTLILGGNDQVHYYIGLEDPKVFTTDYSESGLRKVVTDYVYQHDNLCRDVSNERGCWNPIIVIKPSGESRYKNLVDALDEMKIINAPKYAFDEMAPHDSLLLAEQIIK